MFHKAHFGYRLVKIFFGRGNFSGIQTGRSGGFENQSSAAFGVDVLLDQAKIDMVDYFLGEKLLGRNPSVALAQ